MMISAGVAAWFLVGVLPICLYVCFTDLSQMKIRNHAVVALLAVYAVVGVLVLPWQDYLGGYLHLGIVLFIGFMLAIGGAVGAGDAKFAAAAAPFVHQDDLAFLMILFATTLLAAVSAHRIAKHTPLRRLAPDWVSWNSGNRFPMGLALAGALVLYLGLGAVYGL